MREPSSPLYVRAQVKVGDMMDVMCLELLPGKKMKLSRCEHGRSVMLTRQHRVMQHRFAHVRCLPVPYVCTGAKRCM